ncbi:septum site-determining protein MinC [Poseidonocella sp. HB161398]|uniref:septum site-determining protein MinC n=1 Tax=Poseidonocella sp. HB161398 TaxID=2320855 RepID=UPI001108ED3A|nr:septum site-determining protein MinC [Poseidonocella sp. HB161398]
MNSAVTSDTTAADPVATVKPFQIRGRFFTAVALRLAGDADQDFYKALDAELMRMPHFFDHAPFVIDLEQVHQSITDDSLNALIEGLKRRKLSVFGVQNGNAAQTETAKRAGLLSLPGGRDAPLDRVETQRREAQRMVAERKGKSAAAAAEPAAEPAAAPAAKSASVIVTEPVRSGQKIYADRGDLVVVSSVSNGAELVAAGNIHVYGTLRGRALAGVNGDTSARIFCQSLDADLVAVAGLYLTYDDYAREHLKKPVQVFLEDDKLRVDALR